MTYSVIITKTAAKGLRKAPEYVVDKLRFWIDGVENKGLSAMQLVPGYRDHKLKGNRSHQRSVSLNMLWRAIYEVNQDGDLTLISIEEVTPHRY